MADIERSGNYLQILPKMNFSMAVLPSHHFIAIVKCQDLLIKPHGTTYSPSHSVTPLGDNAILYLLPKLNTRLRLPLFLLLSKLYSRLISPAD